MPIKPADTVTSAIARHVSDDFAPPWFDYRGGYDIDEDVAQHLSDLYCGNAKTPTRDVDLARLNMRRALCQIEDVSVIAATLADRPKRLLREADFPLLCGLLGQPALTELERAIARSDLKPDQRLLVADGFAQLAAWNAPLRPSIDAILVGVLANFAVQSRILNGRLASAATQIQEPSPTLATLVADSKSMPQYFESAAARVAAFPASRLFAR